MASKQTPKLKKTIKSSRTWDEYIDEVLKEVQYSHNNNPDKSYPSTENDEIEGIDNNDDRQSVNMDNIIKKLQKQNESLLLKSKQKEIEISLLKQKISILNTTITQYSNSTKTSKSCTNLSYNKTNNTISELLQQQLMFKTDQLNKCENYINSLQIQYQHKLKQEKQENYQLRLKLDELQQENEWEIDPISTPKSPITFNSPRSRRYSNESNTGYDHIFDDTSSTLYTTNNAPDVYSMHHIFENDDHKIWEKHDEVNNMDKVSGNKFHVQMKECLNEYQEILSQFIIHNISNTKLMSSGLICLLFGG